MTLKKQLKILHELLNEDAREQKQHRQTLKELLYKMKIKEKKLIKQLRQCTDEQERESMHHKINMLHAQRRKGIQSIRSIDQKTL